jgi:hypothetical protein
MTMGDTNPKKAKKPKKAKPAAPAPPKGAPAPTSKA